MMGFPFFPAGMHVQQYPIEIRGIARNLRPATAAPAQQADAATPTSTTAPPSGGAEAAAAAAPPAGATATADGGLFNLPDFSDPNVEVFMEVTPESITIDSLETAMVGSNATAGGDREF